MRIIDRYINNTILTVFIGTVLVFTFLYLIIDITSQLDEFIDRKVPFNILVQYYLSFFPIILVQTASFAGLLATIFTYSGLHNSNEIVAMRSSGLSFWQIARPAICFGIIVSALIFFLNEQAVPRATQITKEIREENMVLLVDRILKKQTKIKNLTFYGLKSRLYYIDTFSPSTRELEGITIIEYGRDQNVMQKIVALKGVWTGIAWKFYQCQITQYGPGGISDPVSPIKFYEEKLMDIKETPDDFLRQRLNVDTMNIQQLKSYISRFSNSGATRAINNLRVDFHQKIAYPIGAFVIVLAGLPFAIMVKSRKGMTFTALGIAVAIGFLFYVANAVALAFGKGGVLPPIFAAWAAPFLFTSMALIVIEYNF